MKKKLILGVLVVIFLLMTIVVNAQETSAQTYEQMSESIAKMLVAGRGVVAEQQEIINTHNAKVGERIPEDQPVSFKGFVPAVYGRLVGQRFKLDCNINVKQTTLGKNNSGPRNLYNKPDEWETEKLEKFTDGSYPRDKGFGEIIEKEDRTAYRYIYPIYIEWSCLKCHGDPKNSPTNDGFDISGKQMEGYTVGELRGGISVTIPIEK